MQWHLRIVALDFPPSLSGLPIWTVYGGIFSGCDFPSNFCQYYYLCYLIIFILFSTNNLIEIYNILYFLSSLKLVVDNVLFNICSLKKDWEQQQAEDMGTETGN